MKGVRGRREGLPGKKGSAASVLTAFRNGGLKLHG